jgi:site-specific recombinase XerD
MSIIDILFQRQYQRIRQREAPLLKEREQYLNHLLRSGVSVKRVSVIASRLLHINRLIGLESLRKVEEVELEQAVERWVAYIEEHPRKPIAATTSYTFLNTIVNWLRFHDLLQTQAPSVGPYDALLTEFMNFVINERKMAPDTIQSYRFKLAAFFSRIGWRHQQISFITISDVDEYLETIRCEGLKPRSIAAHAQALRALFRYLEARNLTRPGIARAIPIPSISRHDQRPKGPRWKDVRKLLKTSAEAGPLELRAVAIASLCSIYGLRGKEIRALTLEDFNWINETFTVRRAKNDRYQEFPIQFEVGEIILRYLKKARPACRFRQLFVTLKPPYRPLHQTTLDRIIKRRMLNHGIESEYFGTHALRHSCATELLRKGASLAEIADFLGHRDIRSVCIYAKFDSRLLKKVAAFSLSDVQ